MINRKSEKERINKDGYRVNAEPDKLYAKFCLRGMDMATAKEKVKKMFPDWER